MPTESEITAAAKSVCEQHAGESVTLELIERVLPDDWGRNLVWRYRVDAPGLPETVIVKTSKLGGGHIFNEWASLEFLARFDALDGLIPMLYGGDEALEMLVMEDLGEIRDCHDLGTILEGSDRELAHEALLAHAKAMALLHRTTAGHESEWNEVRSKYPPNGQVVAKDQFAENLATFRAQLVELGIATASLADEHDQIIAVLAEEPRAWTRGDVCPSNIAYHEGQVRLYDFEMGAYRSIFLSSAYFRVSHLACQNGSLLPADLQKEAEQIYFEGVHPLQDDNQRTYAAAAIALLAWMMAMWLGKPDRPRRLATHHQRLYAALTIVLSTPMLAEPWPETTAALQQLKAKLDQTWAEETRQIEFFPAIRDA